MKYIWIFLIMAGCLFATFSKSEAQIFGPRIHHHYHYTPYYQPYQPYLSHPTGLNVRNGPFDHFPRFVNH